jgi:hypothetical protein
MDSWADTKRLWDACKDYKEVKNYVLQSCKLAWNMSIQRPQMNFQVNSFTVARM